MAGVTFIQPLSKVQYYQYNIKICHKVDRAIANIAIGVLNGIIYLLNVGIKFLNKTYTLLPSRRHAVDTQVQTGASKSGSPQQPKAQSTVMKRPTVNTQSRTSAVKSESP